MRFPASIQKLIDLFSNFPTVGPKTAERFVFYLLKQSPENVQKLALAVAELKEKTALCQTCNAYAESDPCSVCADAKRDAGMLCVVADTRDMLSIEATKQYNGLYFILGGVINSIEGIGPEKLNIQKLTNRINPVRNLSQITTNTHDTQKDFPGVMKNKEGIISNGTREIILALNPDLEGETTAMYLTKLIKQYKIPIKITRLAKGLPSGANLEYADEITLANALKYRNEL